MDDRLTRQAVEKARQAKQTRSPWWRAPVGAVAWLACVLLLAMALGFLSWLAWEAFLLGWEGV